MAEALVPEVLDANGKPVAEAEVLDAVANDKKTQSNIKGPKIANKDIDSHTEAYNGLKSNGSINLNTNSDEVNVTDKSKVKKDRFAIAANGVPGASANQVTAQSERQLQ